MAEANTQIPASRVPLLDTATGLMAREWYRYFVNLQADALASGTVDYDNVRRITFDTTPSPPVTFNTGTMSWVTNEGVPGLGMSYGVIQHIGLDAYAQVENDTGTTIAKGTAVGFAGVGVNNVLKVTPYLANGTTPSLYILGIMAHDLPDSGQQGYCAVWGTVDGVNTTAFSVGDILYPSPTVAGALTNVKPTAPNLAIPIAAVLKVGGADGVLFVRPTIEQMRYYGVFTKTTNQSPTLTNTEYLLTLDNTQISNGVTLGTPASRVVVPVSGLYQVSATVQLTSSNASAKNVWVWFKRNGSNIANTSRLITSDINGGYIPLTLSETFSLAANDYIEMAFAANDNAVSIGTVTGLGASAPDAPAIVMTVQQAQQ